VAAAAYGAARVAGVALVGDGGAGAVRAAVGAAVGG
jgi:hypothetical protein